MPPGASGRPGPASGPPGEAVRHSRSPRTPPPSAQGAIRRAAPPSATTLVQASRAQRQPLVARRVHAAWDLLGQIGARVATPQGRHLPTEVHLEVPTPPGHRSWSPLVVEVVADARCTTRRRPASPPREVDIVAVPGEEVRVEAPGGRSPSPRQRTVPDAQLMSPVCGRGPSVSSSRTWRTSTTPTDSSSNSAYRFGQRRTKLSISTLHTTSRSSLSDPEAAF